MSQPDVASTGTPDGPGEVEARSTATTAKADTSGEPTKLLRGLALIGAGGVLLDLLRALFTTAVSQTSLGDWLTDQLADYAYAILFVLVVVAGGTAVARKLIQSRRGLPPAPPTRTTPAWPPDESPRRIEPMGLGPEPTHVIGRNDEISRTGTLLRQTNLAVVVGEHDVGTSTVAAQAAARYDAEHVAVLDVRGRSAHRPDDVHTTAARILLSFGLDVPSDDRSALLADAADRLIDELRVRECRVLLLDNMTYAEQVGWLVRRWPTGRDAPALLVAGTPDVGTVAPDQSVEVPPLTMSEMRDLLAAGTGTAPPSRLARFVEALLGSGESNLPRPADELLRAFHGRPRAVVDLVRVLDQPGTDWQRPDEVADAVLCTRSGDGPLTQLWTGLLGNPSRTGLSVSAWSLLRALSKLPVTDLPFDAIRAVSAEVTRSDAAAVELRDLALLRESTPEHVRLPFEIRKAVGQLAPSDRDQLGVRAVRAVTHYYAELAARNSELLSVEAEGLLATTWFHQEEPLLRALLTAGEYDTETDPDGGMLDDLATIADGLDTWYVRERQSYGPRAVAEALRTFAAVRPELGVLADIRASAAARRMGDIDPDHLQLPTSDQIGTDAGGRPTVSALDARQHNERALYHLACAERRDTDNVAANEDLDNAEHELRTAWSKLPIDAVTDRMAVQLNLAAVHLRRTRRGGFGEPDVAKAIAHLDQAEALAEVGTADLAGEAQITELRGIADWMRGRQIEAADRWQKAVRMFARVGEEQAEARGLFRLGVAALTTREVAGRLEHGDVRPLDGESTARAALRRLERSKRLCAGQVDTSELDRAIAWASEQLSTPTPVPVPTPAARSVLGHLRDRFQDWRWRRNG